MPTMLSRTIAILVAATLTSATTPEGFMPVAKTPLVVSYGGISALDGVNLPKDSVASQPTIATEQQLKGQYAILMIDIDRPTEEPGKTGTVLHWAQTGLMSADAPTTLNTTAGPKMVYLMQNKMNAAALAPYLGPGPPAKEPLSHRYTLIAVDHTTITQQGLMALSSASQTRKDFNVMNVLMAASLQDKVVAGDFFRVTNPGPVGAGQGGGGKGNGTSSMPPSGTGSMMTSLAPTNPPSGTGSPKPSGSTTSPMASGSGTSKPSGTESPPSSGTKSSNPSGSESSNPSGTGSAKPTGTGSNPPTGKPMPPGPPEPPGKPGPPPPHPSEPGMSMGPGMPMPTGGMPSGGSPASPSSPAVASAPSSFPGMAVFTVGLCVAGTLLAML